MEGAKNLGIVIVVISEASPQIAQWGAPTTLQLPPFHADCKVVIFRGDQEGPKLVDRHD